MPPRAARRAPPPIAVSDERGIRSLHIGGEAIQSAMRISDPWSLHLDYTRCMMASLLFQPDPRTALILGLGGGSIAKFLYRRLRKVRTRAVEIDPRVVAVARAQFGLPPDDARLAVEVGDGATALDGAAVDLLVVDAFDDETPAEPLATKEFFERARAALAPGGVMVANLMSDDPKLARRLRQIREAFGGVVVQLRAFTDENLVVIGLQAPPPRIPWRELHARARVLHERLELPFPRYVRALRAKNRWNYRHLVLHGEDD